MTFDPLRALADIEALCRLGPRFSGSEGMVWQQALLDSHFKTKADRLVWQRFKGYVSSLGRAVPMANLAASWNLPNPRRLLVAAHYDTRPIADLEPVAALRQTPIFGANDGASGVAVLMELARLDLASFGVGIDLVLFDGEECIFDPDRDDDLLGSTHFAKVHESNEASPNYLGAIVIDMVAGRNARFLVEATSYLRAFDLVDEVWSLAEDLGCDRLIRKVGLDVIDDHLPLLNAGIPAINLIDTGYPQWHTLDDIPANCSIEALGQVGTLLEHWLKSKS